MNKINEAKKSLRPPISPKREGRLVTLRYSISILWPIQNSYSMYKSEKFLVKLDLDYASMFSIENSLDPVII